MLKDFITRGGWVAPRGLSALVMRIPLFWRIQIVAWPVFAVLTLPLKFGFFGSLPHAVLVTLYREPQGMLLTWGLRRIFHLQGISSKQPARLGLTVLSLSMLAGAVDTLTVVWLVNHTFDVKSDQSLLGVFCFRSLFYCVWSFLYFWIKDQIAARKRQLELILAETAARDAEILMLRSQVSPHFLFNAFNAILADLERRPASLVPVVQGLSDYFRYSLSTREKAWVPLGGEFDAMTNYLIVEKARFRDSLIIESHIDSSVRGLLVPGIFLQPLVENALKFGHQTSPTPLRIGLRVTQTVQGGAWIEVTNSGCWVDASAARPAHDVGGNGLSNLQQRLALLYRDENLLQVPVPTMEGEVMVRLHFPAPH